MSQMLQWLKEYIKNTPQEKIRENWEAIRSTEIESPNAFEYLKYLRECYCYEKSPDSYSFNQSEKYDSNFLESFFLLRIAA